MFQTHWAPLIQLENIHKAHENNAVVLLDAAQSIQHMPIDVIGLDCDFLILVAIKFMGLLEQGFYLVKSFT